MADRLHTDDVYAIACRVAELIRDDPPPPWRVVDTATVARMLSVSPEWLRDHAAELGAVRINDSPTGPLRFDLDRVRSALDRRRLARDEPPRPRRRPGPRRNDPAVNLLPLPKEAP